jgi:hypothetical protein
MSLASRFVRSGTVQTASCNAVLFSLFFMFTSAPQSRRKLTHFTWPQRAARWRGVEPT